MEKYKIYHHSLLRRSSIDHVVRHVSTGRAKVVLRPQMASPISFSYFWIFFLDSRRRATFRFFYILANGNMVGNLDKNVDVVTGNNTVHDLDSHLFGNLSIFTKLLLQRELWISTILLSLVNLL